MSVPDPFCGQSSDMYLYSGHRIGDVGSIRECQDLTTPTQFCIALGSSLSQAPPIIGYCLPQFNCTAASDILSHITWHNGSTQDPSHVTEAFATSVNTSAVRIFCQSKEGIENPYRSLGIAMLVILLVVITVVLFATTYDIYKKVSAKAELQLLLTGRSAVQATCLTDMPYDQEVPADGVKYQAPLISEHVVSDGGVSSGGEECSNTRRPSPSYGTLPTVYHDGKEVHDSPWEGTNRTNDTLADTQQGEYGDDVRNGPPLDVGVVHRPRAVMNRQRTSPERSRRMRRGGGYSPREQQGSSHGYSDYVAQQQKHSDNYNLDQDADPGHRRAILRKQIELRVEQIIDEIPDFKSLFNRFVLCFSMLAGLKRWRYFPSSLGHTNLFHSIRTLAWMWIIVVDTYIYSAQIPTYSNNVDGTEKTVLFAFMQRKMCDAVAIGTLVLISGYVVIHQLETEGEEYMRDPINYVHRLHQGFCRRWWDATKWFLIRGVKRWLRIVPLYAAVVFLTQSALLQTQGGPFWPIFLQSDTLHINCVQYSAANFAFVNNVVPADVSKRCFPWTYYFAIEFQFFLLAPVVHYLHKTLPLRVYVPAFIFLAVGSLSLRFTSQESCAEQDAGPQPDPLVPNSHDVEKPWSLFLPFAFGALLYYAHRSVLRKAEEMKMFGPETLNVLRLSTMHSTSSRDRLTYRLLLCLNYKRFRIVCIWSGCMLAVGTVILSWFVVGKERDCELRPRWFVTFVTLPWCLAMLLLFLPMMFGYGGLLQKFLTHRLWVGSSKLVFGAYLVGPLVVVISNSIQETPRSNSGVDFFYNAWGNISFSMGLALLFHLVIEQPTMFLTQDVR